MFETVALSVLLLLCGILVSLNLIVHWRVLSGRALAVAKDGWQKHKIWVRLPDGRIGVLDHLKTDGRFGVRPLTETFTYCLNTSEHWRMEDRLRIPEEISVALSDLRPLLPNEIPEQFRIS